MCRDTQVFLPSVFFVFLFEKLSFFYTNRDKTLNAMGAKRGFVPYAPVPLFLFFFSLFLFCCCSLPFSMFASLRVKLVSTLQSRVVTHTHTHTHIERAPHCFNNRCAISKLSFVTCGIELRKKK